MARRSAIAADKARPGWGGLAAVGLAAAGVALLLRPRSAKADEGTALGPVPPGTPRPVPPPSSVYGPPNILEGETAPRTFRFPSEAYADGDWFPVRLTEYHPDAPASQRKMEGGPVDVARVSLITVEQHLADPTRYPYIAVSSDELLHGRRVAYGTRIYLTLANPRLQRAVFRIVDTGGNFRAPPPGEPLRPKFNKQVREAGREPLDIATNHPGGLWQLDGQRVTARIDRSDTLPDPRARRPRSPNA